MVRAVFLDRDGVLVVPEFRDGRSFAPRELSKLQFYPEARDCLSELKTAGYALVVVTNQPDVGRGLVAHKTIEEMHRRLHLQLPVDTIKVCYHTPEAFCSCRKPNPGMLLEAAGELGIDMAGSVMVGDRESDVTAGIAAGCRTVFIDHGYTAEPKPKNATFVADSLSGAVTWILANPLTPNLRTVGA